MPSQVAKKKLRPPLKWHGGKSYLARRIIALFPPHTRYIEPFFGAGSVLLNKDPAETEIVGDKNAALIHFWIQLKDPGFHRFVSKIVYSEENFGIASDWLRHATAPNLKAAGFLVRNRFSRGGLSKDFAWSDRLRGGQPGDVNAWETIKSELPAIAERVSRVQFNWAEGQWLLRANNMTGDLVYCDPPYLHETRTHRTSYQEEMRQDDHVSLLNIIRSHKGMIFISGYRSDLYDSALHGWTRHEFDMPNHSGQGKTKQRRVECVWTNS